jgi:hypothetical protein
LKHTWAKNLLHLTHQTCDLFDSWFLSFFWIWVICYQIFFSEIDRWKNSMKNWKLNSSFEALERWNWVCCLHYNTKRNSKISKNGSDIQVNKCMNSKTKDIKK